MRRNLSEAPNFKHQAFILWIFSGGGPNSKLLFYLKDCLNESPPSEGACPELVSGWP